MYIIYVKLCILKLRLLDNNFPIRINVVRWFLIISPELWLSSPGISTPTHGASVAHGFGPYQLLTPVQGEKVTDNPSMDLTHLCASPKVKNKIKETLSAIATLKTSNLPVPFVTSENFVHEESCGYIYGQGKK